MTADVVRRELAEHERVIARGLKTFVEVGSALMDIRDARLYAVGYETFEDYCQRRWNLTRTRAYELMGAAEMTRAVSEISDTIPATESQAKELRGLEPEQAAEVMTKVAESGEKVTAAKIREVREQVAPRPVAKVTETERTEVKTETFVDTGTGEVLDESPAIEPRPHTPIAAEPESSLTPEQQQADQDEADYSSSVERHIRYLRAFLSGISLAAQMHISPMRDDILAGLIPHERERFLRIEKEASWPTNP